MTFHKPETMIQQLLGKKIREARHDADLSPDELAAFVSSATPSAIERWERGEGKVSILNLIDIAQATGKPIGFFVGDIEESLSGVNSMDGAELQIRSEDRGPLALAAKANLLLRAAVESPKKGRPEKAINEAAQALALRKFIGDSQGAAEAAAALDDIKEMAGIRRSEGKTDG